MTFSNLAILIRAAPAVMIFLVRRRLSMSDCEEMSSSPVFLFLNPKTSFSILSKLLHSECRVITERFGCVLLLVHSFESCSIHP